MNSSAKAVWLAILSVVVAAALVFAGVLLGMDSTVESAVRDFLGLEGGRAESDLDAELEALQKEIIRELQTHYYKEIDPATLAMGAIEGMLDSLGDPYTVYYDPEEYKALQEETSGTYSGLGMAVQMRDRLVTVVTVFPGSPASAVGIDEGDVVVAVDGISTSGKTLDEVVSEIKGPEGTRVILEMYRPVTSATTSTTVTESTEDTVPEHATETVEDITVDLTALPPDGETREYTAIRRSIAIPTTSYSSPLDAGGKKVAHIILFTFNNRHSAEELRAEVERAIQEDKVDAIVLDLRGNGGGLLDEAVKVASIFIENGVIVSTEGLHSDGRELSASGDAVESIPLYVLTDEFTASASEIVAGALQDYGRAILVGESTFGKSLVQSIEELSNEGALKVTTAVYLTPKGRDISATGISPDVLAPDDPATRDVDETLEKVLDLIARAYSPGR